MGLQNHIRKIIGLALWGVVGAGVLVLLVAAIKYRNSNTCKGYRIEILGNGSSRAGNGEEGDGGEQLLFADQKEIARMISEAGFVKGQNKPIAAFDLRRMETALEKNIWIRDAQLFFDNNGFLHVKVAEREPIARVFTRDGGNSYIDSSGVQLPLSEKMKVKLPVFTGYPSTSIHLHGPDSLLTSQVRRLAVFIRNDPFWMAQVSQVDITPARTFELVPTVGNHIVEFGDGSDYEMKFHRLFVFYREVMARTGFDVYARVNIAYAGQVIGVKKGSAANRQDSIQGLNNIRQLIRNAQQLQPDTARLQHVMPLETNTQNEQSLQPYDLIPGEGADSSKRTTKQNKTKP